MEDGLRCTAWTNGEDDGTVVGVGVDLQLGRQVMEDGLAWIRWR
jgi:hypothetical protein